ncbi:hypothetical protein [Thalassolituus sp.]|uniref:hypothetical protein n=1 Tax=Thalassolituus sp. TaxID=2030822 RepID=UPI0032D98D38
MSSFEFIKMTNASMGLTRTHWEAQLDDLERRKEEISPSIYWSALDAASARVCGQLESTQFALFEGDCQYAIALVTVHYVSQRVSPYLKVREIRVSPELSFDIEPNNGAEFRANRQKLYSILGEIFAKCLALSETQDYGALEVKFYGSTKVEMSLFTSIMLDAKYIEENWDLNVSTHGHWLQFSRIV